MSNERTQEGDCAGERVAHHAAERVQQLPLLQSEALRQVGHKVAVVVQRDACTQQWAGNTARSRCRLLTAVQALVHACDVALEARLVLATLSC